MKRIKIFLASSVEDLRDDRLKVGDFFRQLNEIYIDSGIYFSLIMCQDYDSSSTHSEGQSRYDDEIRDSELCFFLFYRKAEDYTRHEFEIALDSFKGEQKPKIVTYFKTVSKEGEVYPEVLSFMNMLSAELHHYYCKYEHIDTLKLGILMQVKLLKLDRGEITLSDGSIAVKGNPVLSTDNIPVLRGNSSLAELTERKRKLKDELDLARQKYLNEPNEENERLFLLSSADLNAVSKELTKVEGEALSFVSSIFEITSSGKVLTKRQKMALEYFSIGNYRSAQLILEDEERENELLRAQNRYEQGKSEIQGYINEDLLWIDAQRAQGVDEASAKAIIERYSRALSLARTHNLEKDFMYEFARFLYEQKSYNRAITIAEELHYYHLNPSCTVDTSMLGAIYDMLGNLYLSTNDYPSAERYLTLCLEHNGDLAKDNPDAYNPELANCYNNLGIMHHREGNYEKAQEFYISAIELREEIAEKRSDGRILSDLADSYINLGVLFLDCMEKEHAEECYLSSLDILKDLAEKNPLCYLPSLAESYTNLGNLYRKLKEYEKSKSYHLLAIEIKKELVNKNPDAHISSLADSYMNIGNLYFSLADYENAKKHLYLSIDIYKRVAKELPDAYEPCLAKAYANACSIHYNLGEYDQAYSLCQMAIEIRERLAGKSPDVYEPELSISYDSMGSVLFALDAFEEAERYYILSLEIKERLDEKAPQVYKLSLAKGYRNAGMLYYSYEFWDDAEHFLNLSSETFKRLSEISDEDFGAELAKIYRYLGDIYARQGDLSNAELVYYTAVYEYERMADEYGIQFKLRMADTYYEMGSAYMRMNETDHALFPLTSALDIYTEMNDAQVPCQEKINKVRELLNTIE